MQSNAIIFQTAKQIVKNGGNEETIHCDLGTIFNSIHMIFYGIGNKNEIAFSWLA